MYLLHSLERENETIKEELEASVATTATPPSTTPPPEIIAVATTTGRYNALIAALKEQSATHTAQITKLLAALSARGGCDGRGDSGRGRRDGGRGRGKSGRGRGEGNTNTAKISNASWRTRWRNATNWKATRPPALTGVIRNSMGSPDTCRGRLRVKK